MRKVLIWVAVYVVAILLHLAVLFGVFLPHWHKEPTEEKKSIEAALPPSVPPTLPPPQPALLEPPPPVINDKPKAPAVIPYAPGLANSGTKSPPRPRTTTPTAPQLREASETPDLALTPYGEMLARELVENGGGGASGHWNGHTYEVLNSQYGIHWRDAQGIAEMRGGYLAIARSAAVNDYLFKLCDDPLYWRYDSRLNANFGPWLGGWSVTARAPWMWIHTMNYGATAMTVSSDLLSFTNWARGMPAYQKVDAETELELLFYAPGENTRKPTWGSVAGHEVTFSYIIEYGPIEVRGADRPVANATWNSHYYEVYAFKDGINWIDANTAAMYRGGKLVHIDTQDENDFVFKLVDDPRFWKYDDATGVSTGPWLGGFAYRDTKVGLPINPAWKVPTRSVGIFKNEQKMAYFNWGPGKPAFRTSHFPMAIQEIREFYAAINYFFGIQFYAEGRDNRQPAWTDRCIANLANAYVVEYGPEPMPASWRVPDVQSGQDRNIRRVLTGRND